MASNTTLNSGSGGDLIVSKERTHDGDTAKQQGVFLSSASGSEGAYTWTDLKIVVEDAAHASGDTGIVAMAVRSDTLAALAGTTGDYTPMQVNASGALYIQEAAALDVSAATVTVDLAGNNDVTVTGGNSHDGTTLGNPVLSGARATNSIEGVTQVANADLTHVQADLNGVLISRPHTTLEEIISERVSNTNGTSTAFTNFAAGGAGIHNYVTTISIFNSSATDGYVDFRDGTAGSVIFTAPAPAAGGSVITFPVPLKGAANTALAYDVSGALSTVYISVIGFQAQG